MPTEAQEIRALLKKLNDICGGDWKLILEAMSLDQRRELKEAESQLESKD
jgi:hypothetical protein